MMSPFDITDCLRCICSGVVADEKPTNDLLTAYEQGSKAPMSSFSEKLSEKSKFFDSIKQLKLRDFNTMPKRTTSFLVWTELPLFPRLMIASQQRNIDIRTILGYSLNSLPLSIADLDG